ncbi:GIY-YIG nuclease family protein [Rhodobacter sp. Har01]|uniref:GIY-YIG nuclease family protein n=1 Tax=Rhodobacter sp. Har01 TaxID=2883999 RepID=UPI001D09413B|nr:GIY-YIG nuclease family protein [Rhodobacter sp. Har01]MCB6177535.1 GIY-YIG nuclease family protein [Rhodobacter sp. Har01]
MTGQIVPFDRPEQGWLYVLTNPAMPKLCKVGYTTRSPEERAVELHTTGVPMPFRIVASWPTSDAREAERVAHKALAHYRTSEAREWFSVDVPTAIERIEKALNVTTQAPAKGPWRFVRGIVEAFGWLSLALLAAGLMIGGAP